MFYAILMATNNSFQKGMTFCRSVYVKKVMKLLAFIFEQPSYACMHACIYVYMYVRMYVCLSVCLSACEYVYMCVCQN